MTNSQGTKTFETPQAAAVATAAPARTVSIRNLPRMLSPTLPACIEERLAKLRGEIAQAESHPVQNPGSNRSATVNNRAVTTTFSTSNSPKAKRVTKDKNLEPHKSRTAAPTKESTSASRSKVPDGELTTKSIPRQDPATAKDALATNITAGRISKASVSEPKQYSKIPSDVLNAERHLLVVLRIPKGLRKNCQRILQLQPRPKKLPSASQQSSSLALQERIQDRTGDQTVSKGQDDQQTLKQKAVNGNNSRNLNEITLKPKVVANGLVAPRSGETRRLANPDKEPPSKRQRLSGIDLSRPQTPVGPAIRSPVLPQYNSGNRSQLSTPRTDRKSTTAMDRIKSSEGEVKTPLGSIRSNTPVILGSTEPSHNREGRSSSNVSANSVAALSKKDEEVSVYKAEFTKYADMAKSLKREADALAKSPGGHINTDSTIRRQGLAKAIETALCYMLAFTIKDEPSRIKKVPGDRAVWESLLPYFNFLKNITRDTESLQLQGLLYQLEAVCRDTIHRYDIERLERETVADETLLLIKQMAESGRQARQAWIDGTKWLTHDDLRQSFPETWVQRSKSPGEKLERLLPQRYNEGSYFLPLGNTSTNIEAVRAGWSFLREWCKKEGVDWNGKIGL